MASSSTSYLLRLCDNSLVIFADIVFVRFWCVDSWTQYAELSAIVHLVHRGMETILVPPLSPVQASEPYNILRKAAYRELDRLIGSELARWHERAVFAHARHCHCHEVVVEDVDSLVADLLAGTE